MDGKKETCYRNYLIYIALAMVLLITFGGISTAKTNIDKKITINLNKFYDVPMLEVKAGDVLSVEIQVTSGGDVDIFLMKDSDFGNYQTAITQRGTANFIAGGSSQKVSVKQYTYTFTEAGDYHLVIDNTDVPKGGALPMDQVEMNLKVKVDAPSSENPPSQGSTPSGSTQTASSSQPAKSPGFGAILAAFVIVALAIRKK